MQLCERPGTARRIRFVELIVNADEFQTDDRNKYPSLVCLYSLLCLLTKVQRIDLIGYSGEDGNDVSVSHLRIPLLLRKALLSILKLRTLQFMGLHHWNATANWVWTLVTSCSNLLGLELEDIHSGAYLPNFNNAKSLGVSIPTLKYLALSLPEYGHIRDDSGCKHAITNLEELVVGPSTHDIELMAALEASGSSLRCLHVSQNPDFPGEPAVSDTWFIWLTTFVSIFRYWL
jgi:hypothetical protein